MSAPGSTVSGGGSIAVDTPAMQQAAVGLEALGHEVSRLSARIVACLADAAWSAAPSPPAHAALEHAAVLVRGLVADLEEAAGGLRIAAERYGTVEHAVAAVQQAAWAGSAAVLGAATRVGVTLAGPGFLLLPTGLAAVATGAAVGGVLARELLITGRIDPQVDPAVLAEARLALASSDDLVRGFRFTEAPGDLTADDPGAPDGTGSTAAALAGLLPASGGSTALTASILPGTVTGPRTLGGLGERTPEAAQGGTQIRLDRYPMADGRSRWIVYVCGTVTFSPAAGTEPFDLRSDVVGVGGGRSDSELALAAGMRRAGVRHGDPVLLVGHSQGALDAVRLTQHGDFDVRGVVTLGGPTGQLVLPRGVPELSVEHTEDVVPVLGGAASAGLGRLVLRRSLYGGGAPPGPPLVPFAAGAAPHALTAYRRTLALADASPDPRIAAFEDDLRPFLSAGNGRIVLVRADRRVRSARGR